MAEPSLTRTRRAILRAIDEGHGRIYLEEHEAWDRSLGLRITHRLRQLVDAGWVRARTETDKPLPGEHMPDRVYYRLTTTGIEKLKGAGQ